MALHLSVLQRPPPRWRDGSRGHGTMGPGDEDYNLNLTFLFNLFVGSDYFLNFAAE